MASATATEAVIVVAGASYRVPPQGLHVGRAPDNDVVLPDPNVSRQHLIIWSTPRGTFLRDLGSQNGTYIGERPVGPGPEEVPPGSRVRIGQTELLVDVRNVARPRSGPPMLGLVLGGIALAVLALMGISGFVLFRALTASSSSSPSATQTPAATAGAVLRSTVAPASPSPSPPPTAVAAQAPGGRDQGLVRALAGSMRVLAPAGPNQFSAGSGTVITVRGHVLTNRHVIADETTGQLLNRGQGVIIAVPPNEGEAARPKFLARVIADDNRLDFAVLRIVSAANGGPLTAELGLLPVPVGDSDTVRIGDQLTIIGYPGLGGEGVTVTRGIHSGVFVPDDEPGVYFKTDTEINRGNSGGTAINAAGQFVGVPTAGRTDRSTAGKLGLVRPINLAKPLIERANQDR
ncbi:MAG TPA: trypsin-like peptidase domain-containing protein [Chloroflexota bacterium]|nr:trypsin-like peptidase domain-containing protein [Chloroflexota bacterium]